MTEKTWDYSTDKSGMSDDILRVIKYIQKNCMSVILPLNVSERLFSFWDLLKMDI